MGHYAAIERNDILILENRMLNKISQRQTDKYCLIPFYQVQERWKIRMEIWFLSPGHSVGGGPFIPAQSLGGFLSLLLGYSLEMRIHNSPL